MKLAPLSPTLSVCRLEPGSAIPAWATRGGFFAITRTDEELSVVCEQANLPAAAGAAEGAIGLRVERDWRALKVQGPLDFGLTGILAALAQPLAQAGISIFAISTFDTDYLLVRAADLERAVETLREASHEII